MESGKSHGQKYKKDRIQSNHVTTLCGRYIHSTAVSVDVGLISSLCKNCERSTMADMPPYKQVWMFDWVGTGSADGLQRTVRAAVNLSHIRIVISHSKWLTRIWITPKYPLAIPSSKYTVHYVLSMTKLWIDSKFYRSMDLGDYLANIL